MNKTQSSNIISSPSPYAFWIGFPLMLLFVCAGIGGGSWALDRILLEYSLYKNGEVTPGLVLQKMQHVTKKQTGGIQTTTFTISYRFEVNSRSISNEVRVEGERFHPLKKGGPIDIRYLPDEPDKNLPDGSRVSSLYMFFTAFGFVIGLGALVVATGMVVDRVRNDKK